MSRRLDCLGESNTVGAEVVHRVPPAEESVTKDDKRTSRGGNVKAHEGRDT